MLFSFPPLVDIQRKICKINNALTTNATETQNLACVIESNRNLLICLSSMESPPQNIKNSEIYIYLANENDLHFYRKQVIGDQMQRKATQNWDMSFQQEYAMLSLVRSQFNNFPPNQGNSSCHCNTTYQHSFLRK